VLLLVAVNFLLMDKDRYQQIREQRKENLAKNLANIDEDASKVLEDLKESRIRRQQKRTQVLKEISDFADIQRRVCDNRKQEEQAAIQRRASEKKQAQELREQKKKKKGLKKNYLKEKG